MRRALTTFVSTQRVLIGEFGAARALRWNGMLASAWLRDRMIRRYRVLDEAGVRVLRRSETVFVFGSGASLNDISAEEWAHFAEHDVVGFNAFQKERWIPVDFHILRGAVYGELRWRPYAQAVRDELAANEFYRDTVYVLQSGYFAQHGNQLVGYGLLPQGARVVRYHTVPGWGPPTRHLADGLRHAVGTLDDAVNFAFVLGWREIVLVGVDLYDSRYFWLDEDETVAVDAGTGALGAGAVGMHGQAPDAEHNTARNGVVRLMGEWGEVLRGEGVQLRVYNPRSLLADVLPTYERASR